MAKNNNGKKFPDFSEDGEVTMKDVLMGKGVIPKPGHKRKDREDSSQDLFIEEVMSRVEENILLEKEHIQNVLAEAEENGIDVDYLTEEELSELFGFGMDRSTSRDAVLRQRTRRRAQKSRRNRRAAMMDRLAKLSNKRKSAEDKTATPAAQKPAAEKKKDSAVSNLASAPNRNTGSGGDDFQRKQAEARAKKKAKADAERAADTGDRHRADFGDSTDIVRGARMGLAERVLSQMLSEEERDQTITHPSGKKLKVTQSQVRARAAYNSKAGRPAKPGKTTPKPTQ